MLRKRRTKTGVSYLEISPGVRFFDTAYYARCFGISRKAFSSLCDALNVPFFHLNNRSYVRYEILLAAMAAVSLLGQPDFIGPACGNAKPKKRRHTKHLNLTDYEANLDRTIHSILWGLKLHRIEPSPAFESDLHAALSSFMASCTLIHTSLTASDPTLQVPKRRPSNPKPQSASPDGGTGTGETANQSIGPSGPRGTS